MAPFQAKIRCKTLRKRENKNCRFVLFRFYMMRNRKFQKNSKNIQKVKKIPFWLHFKPKFVVKRRKREKIKIVVSFYFVSTRREIENSKKIAKSIKKLKNIILAPFQAKIGCKMQRKRENKNFYSVPFRFVPTRREIENSKKIAKMFKKFKKYHLGSISGQNWL